MKINSLETNMSLPASIVLSQEKGKQETLTQP